MMGDLGRQWRWGCSNAPSTLAGLLCNALSKRWRADAMRRSNAVCHSKYQRHVNYLTREAKWKQLRLETAHLHSCGLLVVPLCLLQCCTGQISRNLIIRYKHHKCFHKTRYKKKQNKKQKQKKNNSGASLHVRWPAILAAPERRAASKPRKLVPGETRSILRGSSASSSLGSFAPSGRSP